MSGRAARQPRDIRAALPAQVGRIAAAEKAMAATASTATTHRMFALQQVKARLMDADEVELVFVRRA